MREASADVGNAVTIDDSGDQRTASGDTASQQCLRKNIQDINKLDIPPEEKSRRIQVFISIDCVLFLCRFWILYIYMCFWSGPQLYCSVQRLISVVYRS